MGGYFSRSWSRGRIIRDVDARDESLFVWLSQLNPDDADEMKGQLEQRLGELPKFVGGKIIVEAAELLYVLRESDRLLSQVKPWMRSLSPKSVSQVCDLLKRTKVSYIQLQPQVSLRYQALFSLTQALAPLTLRLEAPTRSVDHFIKWWLGRVDDTSNTVLKEVRQLSRAHVKLWGDQGILEVCRAI